jgi:hypothetical protein
MSETERDVDSRGEVAGLPWERPVVTLLGNLRDLVRGGPKSPGNLDHDEARKTPSGQG